MATRNTRKELGCAKKSESNDEEEVHHEPTRRIRLAREIDETEHTTEQNNTDARPTGCITTEMTLALIQRAREERDAFVESMGLPSNNDSSDKSSDFGDEDLPNDGHMNSEDEEEFDGWLSYFNSLEGD